MSARLVHLTPWPLRWRSGTGWIEWPLSVASLLLAVHSHVLTRGVHGEGELKMCAGEAQAVRPGQRVQRCTCKAFVAPEPQTGLR